METKLSPFCYLDEFNVTSLAAPRPFLPDIAKVIFNFA